MKALKYLVELARNDAATIAVFGNARLVKTHKCKYELRGGSKADRMQAREWISLFFHDAVVREL